MNGNNEPQSKKANRNAANIKNGIKFASRKVFPKSKQLSLSEYLNIKQIKKSMCLSIRATFLQWSFSEINIEN